MSFNKYSRGAYHWDSLSVLPWKHHCYTATRYALVLEAADNINGCRVLDVGCGDGALLGLACKSGAICTGVEPDEAGRKLAVGELAKRGLSAHIHMALADIAESSQDTVFFVEVIEHVADPDALLREIKGKMLPGGRIIITTPIRVTETPLDLEHVKEYFPSEMRALVERHFSVEVHNQEFPAFAVEIYYWRPWFLLGLPVTKWVMNILSAWFKVRAMRGMRSLNRYPTIQLLVARKAS